MPLKQRATLVAPTHRASGVVQHAAHREARELTSAGRVPAAEGAARDAMLQARRRPAQAEQCATMRPRNADPAAPSFRFESS
jgi:hypothetical protein